MVLFGFIVDQIRRDWDVLAPLPGAGNWGARSGGIAPLNHRLQAQMPPASHQMVETRLGASDIAFLLHRRFRSSFRWPPARSTPEGWWPVAGG